ncbi:MAG: hypothetical protein ACK45R_09340 [Candidatus Kapaibacterium sp.]|jgi:hypothetical protein
MKNIVALIGALAVGIFAIGIFYWLMGQIFWIAFQITKLIVAMVIAVPIFFYIRRKLLR